MDVATVGKGLLKVVRAIQLAAKKAAENRQDIDLLSRNLEELTPIFEQIDNPKKPALQGVPESTSNPLILGLHSALHSALKAIKDCEGSQEKWLGLKPVVYAEAHAAALRRATKLVHRYLGQIFKVLALQQNENVQQVLASLETLHFKVSEGTRKLQAELQGIHLDGSKQLAILQKVAQKLEIPEEDVLGHFTTMCKDLGIKELRAADISKGTLLYSGHQTAVYKATLTCGLQFGNSFRETQTVVAVKEFRNAAYLFNKFRSEVEMLQGAATCDNVCRLVGVYETETDLALVMRFYEGGDLGRAIHRADGGLGWDVACKYGLDVSKALVELHQSNIVVRDLKPQNVLLDKSGSAIVADFGISKPVYTTLRTYAGTRAEASGTIHYMAPEAFSGNYGKGTDSWSFACLVLEMVTGEAPFRGESLETVWAKVVKAKATPGIPPSTPPQLVEVLSKCFSYEQSERPSFQEIYLCFFQEHETRKTLAFLKTEAETTLEALLSEKPLNVSALRAAIQLAIARGVDGAAIGRAESGLGGAVEDAEAMLRSGLERKDRVLLTSGLKAAADVGGCNTVLVSHAKRMLEKLRTEEKLKEALERDLAGTDLASLRTSLAAYARCKPDSPLVKQGQNLYEVLEEFVVVCDNLRAAIKGMSTAQLRVAVRALRDLQSHSLLQREALTNLTAADLLLRADRRRADLEALQSPFPGVKQANGLLERSGSLLQSEGATTAPRMEAMPEGKRVFYNPKLDSSHPAKLFEGEGVGRKGTPCPVGLNILFWVCCWPVHLVASIAFLSSCCCLGGTTCELCHPPGCGVNEHLCLCDWAHWSGLVPLV